jgi:hypothetical protein
MLKQDSNGDRPTKVRPEEMGLTPRFKLKSRMHELKLNGRDVSARSAKYGIYISQSALSGFLTGRMNPYMAEKRCLSKLLRCAQKDLFDE